VAPPGESFSLAFLDPPYGKGLATLALASLVSGGWLASGAMLVIEEAAGAVVELPEAITREDERRYGDTQFIFARRVAA
jgi:16S rRNA (guanine966-N2)-methyltransferase